MALTHDQIDDFVALTLPNIKTGKWTDLSLEHQDYVSSKLIDAKKVVERGGKTIDFRIQVRNIDTVRVSGLYDEDQTAVDDVMESASVPWSKQTGNYSYDVDEDLFQSDRETIIRELILREHACLNAFAEKQEEWFWGEPSSSSDKRPMGLPFWVRKSNTTPAGAFNGGNPTATGLTSGCAGVSSTTYPRWRNWAFSYSAVTQEDLITKLKKAIAFTNFIAPVPHPTLMFGATTYEMFTTYTVQDQLERLAESRNDNLGRDLAKYIGAVTVAGIPCRWVPYLNSNDDTDPIYGINWATFRPYVKKGANMRRSPPMVAPKQHTVRTIHIDNWMNYICIDRRRNFVGYIAS